MPVIHPIKLIVEQSARLARAFRERGLPVRACPYHKWSAGAGQMLSAPKCPRPPNWAEIVPEMERQPNDHIVYKTAGRGISRH